jgi:hypothetical protein
LELIRPGQRVPELRDPADEMRTADSPFDAVRNGGVFQAEPVLPPLPDWAQDMAAASRDAGPADGVES